MNTIKQSKIVAYLQTSTDRPNVSIEHQRESITQWSNDNNAEVVSFYSDEDCHDLMYCAPSYEDMLNAISTGQLNLDAIVVYDYSRIGKNDFKLIDAFAIFKTHETKLISASEHQLREDVLQQMPGYEEYSKLMLFYSFLEMRGALCP